MKQGSYYRSCICVKAAWNHFIASHWPRMYERWLHKCLVSRPVVLLVQFTGFAFGLLEAPVTVSMKLPGVISGASTALAISRQLLLATAEASTYRCVPRCC